MPSTYYAKCNLIINILLYIKCNSIHDILVLYICNKLKTYYLYENKLKSFIKCRIKPT